MSSFLWIRSHSLNLFLKPRNIVQVEFEGFVYLSRISKHLQPALRSSFNCTGCLAISSMLAVRIQSESTAHAWKLHVSSKHWMELCVPGML